MLPTLRASREGQSSTDPAVMGAEDFSFIKIKFWFISLGGAPKENQFQKQHHTIPRLLH
jgi:metal-dependent amidase/aminoacylase/carboxypeptidase family protein